MFRLDVADDLVGQRQSFTETGKNLRQIIRVEYVLIQRSRRLLQPFRSH